MIKTMRRTAGGLLAIFLVVLSDSLTAVAAQAPFISLKQGGEPRAVTGVAFPGGTSLPFGLEIDYRCPAGTQRQQLIVSAADTITSEDVPAGASPRTVRLDVPLKQLEWLMQPARACGGISPNRQPESVNADGVRFYRLHGATTAFATLYCVRDQAATTAVTATIPLDAWLSCPAN